jgi:tRNA(adenine34) deaminase
MSDYRCDEGFMQEALKEAKKGFDAGEVPVGAVLVYRQQIIARAHNRVEELKDASAHAEMLCLKEGFSFFQNWRLLESTLYCTLEPCMMCAGGLLLSRVETLVWGAKDIRHGANGSFINVFLEPHPTHQMIIRTGVLQEECSSLMKEFFKGRRNAKII